MAYLLNPLQSPLGVLLFIAHLLVIARAITRPNREPASRVARAVLAKRAKAACAS